MKRALLAVVVAAMLPAAACASFKDRRTPSGDFCSDMAVIPAGQEPSREYHRLQPIQSDPKARTEAERLESLRKAACNVSADAVIEAVNEEVRGDNAQYGMVSSGTAVIWLHHNDGPAAPVPVGALPTKGTPATAPAPAAPPPPSPPPPPDATAQAAAPTAKSAKAPPAKPPVLRVLMRPSPPPSSAPPPPPPPSQ